MGRHLQHALLHRSGQGGRRRGDDANAALLRREVDGGVRGRGRGGLQESEMSHAMKLGRVGVRATAIVIALGVVSVSSVWAHHSFAPYEPSKQIKLSGVVTEFKW